MKRALHMKFLALLEMKCFAKAKHEVKYPLMCRSTLHAVRHFMSRRTLHIPTGILH